ncbi:MAG: phosphoribosylglycinamide formyltransferase [Balneolaceae bacterium]
MKNLVVFASGSGSNFQAIIDSIKKERIQASITGLITNKADIGAVERAKKNSIPVRVMETEPEHEFANNLLRQFEKWTPDFIILAGFLKKIPDVIIKKFPDRIINIHPSLLPKYGGKGFYGKHVHRAVIEAGETESGCTVHYVNEEYDQGDIIDQIKVPVLPGDTPDTLAARILKQEHQLLPSVIKNLTNQK